MTPMNVGKLNICCWTINPSAHFWWWY